MTEPVRNFQHYEVLRRDDGSPWELGRGAMGITYKAFDVNLCCEVALKVVNSALLKHPNARQRFVREARAAAALRHRNVASVYHLGNDGEHFFYAMEFIDGQTLDALVKQRGPMPVGLALRVMLQVAKALVAAERQQLVHRDIKPSNLMIVHEDGDDEMTVKVIDFGLARPAAGAQAAAEVTIGGFVGTPQYASPEQLEEQPLDARSDIYSLGVTAWYLLTSAPPFAGSLATVCQQQVGQPPPWDRLPATLPESVRRLLGHLLAKARDQRPQNARELRVEIEDALDSLPETLRAQEWEIPAATENLPLNKLVGERYLLSRLLVESPGSRVYLARDEADEGEPVIIRTLPAQLVSQETDLAGLRDEIRLIQAATHPGLVEIYALEESTGALPAYLVEETLHGFTWRDLLAAHDGALPLEGALSLLDQAATAADHAATCRLEHIDLTLRRIYVHFPFASSQGEGADSLRPLPMSGWPTWRVKIHPFALGHGGTDFNTWVGDLTLLREEEEERPSGSSKSCAAGHYVEALAKLTCELLGGVPGMVGARTTTLASLSEAGNAVLREAMAEPERFTSCHEFYDALARATTGMAAVAGSHPGVVALPLTTSSAKLSGTTFAERRAVRASSGADSTTTRNADFFRSPPSDAKDLPGTDGDGGGGVWDRLHIGRPDGGRPVRWLLAFAAVIGVFLCAFAGALLFLLHGGFATGREGTKPAATSAATQGRSASTEPAPTATPTDRLSARIEPPASTPAPARVVVRPLPLPTAAKAPDEPSARVVNVHLFSKPRGAEVRWRGNLLGITPTDARFPPGDQELVVRFPSGPETHQTIRLSSEQEDARIEIQPMRSDLVPLNIPPPREPRGGGASHPSGSVPQPFFPGPKVEPAVPVAPPPRQETTPVRRPSALEPFRDAAEAAARANSDQPKLEPYGERD